MAKLRSATKGATLGIDTAGGTTYADVTKCSAIKPPGKAWAQIEAAALDDTDVGGLPGVGEMQTFSATIHWDPDDTVDQSLITAMDADTKCGFRARITRPDGTTHDREWKGYITRFEPVAYSGEVLSAELEGVVAADDASISDTVSV